MWNRNGATLKAFRVLSAKVWNMDVWFKQTILADGKAT